MPGDLIFQAMPNLLSNVLTIAELHITDKKGTAQVLGDKGTPSFSFFFFLFFSLL